LEVKVLLLLHDLFVLGYVFVLGKQPLGFVVNKIAEYFETVLLLNFLPFKQLRYTRNLMPYFFKFIRLLIQLSFQIIDSV
jgi:hypothetical protein